MSQRELMSVYDSQSEQYHRAFQVFLAHTDQKQKAREWLDILVESLPSRRLFIDAGAGNGMVTEWYIPRFDRTIGFDPNPLHVADLRELAGRYRSLEVLEGEILTVTPASMTDFVLASHVFYYIDDSRWMENLQRLASWLSPDGVLAVVLQNHETDCMRMREHFLGQRYGLSALARRFRQHAGDQYEVSLHRVDAQITTPDFDSAYTIAEFMLNLVRLTNPPPRAQVEEYVRTQFAAPSGGYRFSCHQDFLRIGTSSGYPLDSIIEAAGRPMTTRSRGIRP